MFLYMTVLPKHQFTLPGRSGPSGRREHAVPRHAPAGPLIDAAGHGHGRTDGRNAPCLPSLKEDPLMNHKTLLDPLHSSIENRARHLKRAMGIPSDAMMAILGEKLTTFSTGRPIWTVKTLV